MTYNGLSSVLGQPSSYGPRFSGEEDRRVRMALSLLSLVVSLDHVERNRPNVTESEAT